MQQLNKELQQLIDNGTISEEMAWDLNGHAVFWTPEERLEYELELRQRLIRFRRDDIISASQIFNKSNRQLDCFEDINSPNYVMWEDSRVNRL